MTWGIFKTDSVSDTVKKLQEKLDKNHNGELDSQDFKILSKEETDFSLFSEKELDMLINEANNANMTAGAWINDFLHAQQRLMATKGMNGKDAKALALAAYYNHQAKGKPAEFTEGRMNLDAKEIKHINLKDKRNDAEIMEPRAEGEKAFVDTHTLIVTNDPTQTKYDAGTGKVGKAVEPKAQGAGKYDAKEKLGNQGITSKKGEFSEAIVNTGPTATGCQVGEVIDTAPQEKKAKKTYGKFKQEIGHEIK